MNQRDKRSEPSISPARRIAGDALLALSAAFTAGLSVQMRRRIRAVVLKDGYRKLFRYELGLCGIVMLDAADWRFGFLSGSRSKALRPAGRILGGALHAAAGTVLLFCGKIAAGGLIKSEAPASHAIVLGMALENGQPTKDLLLRLDTAAQFHARHPEALLILTGGNPDERGRSEAAVMRELLAARGVPEEAMLLEDRAETTRENFENTARMIDPARPVVLISSGYHMDRACRMAKNAGFSRILRLPAPSDPRSFGTNLLLEVMMEINELTLKQR